MAALRQEGLDGELVLEQNDGVRRLFWSQGNLLYVQSEVAGEQFGNYLLRQGVLDLPALNELLANDEHYRIGEKVVQWGLMTLESRDAHLLALQEQVMIHALEHAVIGAEWKPGPLAAHLTQDLPITLQHRNFIWSTFQEAHNLEAICDLLYAETTWKWEGRTNLLETVADLPLDPTTAYALSFLGTESISYETFLSLSRLQEEEAARLMVTLWALGVLTLTRGKLPLVGQPVAAAAPPFVPIPLAPVPAPTPRPASPSPVLAFDATTPQLPPPPRPGNPSPTPSALAFDRLPLELLPLTLQPEFLDPEGLPSPLNPPNPPGPETTPNPDGASRPRKLFLKARQLLLQERTVEAIRALEQSVQLEPDTDPAYEPWLLLGKLRMANPAWSTRSIDALQTASRLRPKAAEPWASMGEVYHRKGFKANAIACFHRALELDPSVPIPPEVDLRAEEPTPAHPVQPTSGSLFSRFRSLLSRTD